MQGAGSKERRAGRMEIDVRHLKGCPKSEVKVKGKKISFQDLVIIYLSIFPSTST